MPLVPIQARPGFNTQKTQVQNGGGWFAGNLVRWRQGDVEKLPGWIRLVPDPFRHFIRRLHAWLDLDNRKNLLVGTDLGLQIVVQDTPYVLGIGGKVVGGSYPGMATGAKFSATSGSKVVTVLTSTPLPSGQSFVLTAPISIGGRVLDAGTAFLVSGYVTGGFTFDMPLAATVTEGPVYGMRLFTNTAAPDVMTVTFNAHGLTPGATFTIAQKTEFKSNPLSGLGFPFGTSFTLNAGTTFTVATVPNANTFTFVLGMAGFGDGSGAAVYEGWSVTLGSGTPIGSPGAVMIISVGFFLTDPQKQTWHLANLGQDGLAVPTGGPLLLYHPPITSGPFVTVVPTAPTKNDGMITAMPQAQVILWGTEPILGSGVVDPLLLRFSDAGTYDSYTATVSNQAGSYRLSRGSRIVGAIQAPQTTLIFTDTDVWSMSYIGAPLIYGFTIVGTGCGLAAPHAVVTLGRTTYWQGSKSLWQYGDSGVQPVLSTVHDFIFDDMDVANLFKCHAGANSIGNEVAFYFPSRRHPWYVGPAGGPGSDTDPPPSIPADVNLLTLPNSFDAWAQNAASAQVSGFGPDGVTPATRLGASVDAGEHYIEHPDISVQSTQETYTYSVYAHTTSDWNLGLRMTTGNQATVFALFDLSTHTLVNSGGPVVTPLPPPFEKFYPSFISAGVETDALATGAAGNGWYRFTLTYKSDVGPTARVGVSLISGTDWSFTGDGSIKFITVWGAALNTGETAVDPEVEQVNPTGTMLSNEPNRYVKYNTVEHLWDSGFGLGRTAWINNNVFGMPMGADFNFRVQQHERGFDDDDQPMRGVYAELGYSRIGDGSQMISIHQCQPDFKWFGRNGAVNLTLKTLSYAGSAPLIYGPYSMTANTQFFNPRARARFVAIRYDWAERRGFSARVGAVMLKVKATGRMP